MKKMYISIIIMLVVVFLDSCGGGSSTSEKGSIATIIVKCDNSNAATATNDCGDATVPDYFTCLKDGTTLIEDTVNSVVTLVHTPTIKKVCVLSGSAHIVQ